MPIVLTFDLQGAPPVEHNRIQSFFERLGWQNLGGSSYRYPKLGSTEPVEDWLNHVVPALMLFRAYLLTTGRPLTKFTLDSQTSAGYDQAGAFGETALAAANVRFYAPSNPAFGLAQLRNWLDGVRYPYP